MMNLVSNKHKKSVNERQTWPFKYLVLFCTIISLTFFYSCDSDESNEDTLKIGVLLPYTGNGSVYGPALERTAIMFADMLNENGGLCGKTVEMVFADSHSDSQKSLTALNQLLTQEVVAVVGPENADVATEILTVLQARKKMYITPYIGASVDTELEPGYPWYRIAPTASSLGNAIAKELITRGKMAAAFVHGSDAYSTAFASIAAARFQVLGGEVKAIVAISDTSFDYSDAIAEIYQKPVTTIVLAAQPTVGARFTNDISVRVPNDPDNPREWFFSPSLKTDVFIQNTDSSEIEDAMGVVPKLINNVEDQAMFDEYDLLFAENWHGDAPLEGAYFYYDALALLAIAIEKSAYTQNPPIIPNFESISTAFKEVANPSGILTSWKSVPGTLKTVRTEPSKIIQYSGFTGPVSLSESGARHLGTSIMWSIKSGKITTETTSAN